MTTPRLDIDLTSVTHNTRTLVDRLAPRGIAVTGISKALLGSPAVAAAMARGGVDGLGDSRIENLRRLQIADTHLPLMMIRTPMLSQVERVVSDAHVSLNSSAVVLDALAAAAVRQQVIHEVVVMVELGDLREGVAICEVVAMASSVARRPGLRLVGLGTNLACQSGVAPDQTKMDQLSELVGQVERDSGATLAIVSGGNSANLDWALATTDVGRINHLRLGEAILLGTEPLHRTPIEGLRTDAFTLTAEIIESSIKPARPWGRIAQTAFGHQRGRRRRGTFRHAIVALGRQDADPAGLTPPPGITVLGMSSDHLVLDVGDHAASVGDELSFGLDYSALLRASTSPFTIVVEREPTNVRGSR